ncbi:shikimate kinase [Thaumasiovibrio sp. DFM-14]|uniref:shikimate kinase n=1 Tax=Thaumasiovibrio sp. DFM-14 TaxID=3384792 RepID=UPI0039A01405
MERKNIVITGLMGSGKTTLGRLVARKLNRSFIDTDEYLVSNYGPASDILNLPNGDEIFRLTESKVALDLSKQNNLVISTGGRFMLNQKNIDLMQENGEVYCLQAALTDIVNRLNAANGETYRPRFEKANDKLKLMEELEKQSNPYFEQFIKIQTSGRSLADITTEIVSSFTQKAHRRFKPDS